MLYTFGGLTVILSLVILALLVLVFHPDTGKVPANDARTQALSVVTLRGCRLLCFRVVNQLRGLLWRTGQR